MRQTDLDSWEELEELKREVYELISNKNNRILLGPKVVKRLANIWESGFIYRDFFKITKLGSGYVMVKMVDNNGIYTDISGLKFDNQARKLFQVFALFNRDLEYVLIDQKRKVEKKEEQEFELQVKKPSTFSDDHSDFADDEYNTSSEDDTKSVAEDLLHPNDHDYSGDFSDSPLSSSSSQPPLKIFLSLRKISSMWDRNRSARISKPIALLWNTKSLICSKS